MGGTGGWRGSPRAAKVCWPHNLYPSVLPTNAKKCSTDHRLGLLQTYGPIQMSYCRFRNSSLAARLRPGTLGRPSSLLWAVIFHYQEVEKTSSRRFEASIENFHRPILSASTQSDELENKSIFLVNCETFVSPSKWLCVLLLHQRGQHYITEQPKVAAAAAATAAAAAAAAACFHSAGSRPPV